MRNRNELFIVIATVAILACMVFSVLGIGTGCSDRSTASVEEDDDDAPKKGRTFNTATAKAHSVACLNNCKNFAQANGMYAMTFYDYVTPIAWGDGVNIWPAILWNIQNEEGVQMPYEDYSSDRDKWLKVVKNSKMFSCPADADSEALPDSASDMPKLSYGINRNAVRKMRSSANACNIPVGPVLQIADIRKPSQMIYIADTSWNKGASASNAAGRLYSTKNHPSYGFKPGSIIHHWDQGQLAPEFNGGSGMTEPWHPGKTWNYSFMDGHAESLRPEQTVKSGRNVADREPSGYWTWNEEPWGQEPE